MSLFLITKNYDIFYVLLFCFGWCSTGKQFVGYSYLIELMPKDKQVLMGSLEFMFEASIYLSICGYFYYIGKFWHFVLVPALILATCGIIGLTMLPESPRFLVSMKKYD
jgi:hypothetical protein